MSGPLSSVFRAKCFPTLRVRAHCSCASLGQRRKCTLSALALTRSPPRAHFKPPGYNHTNSQYIINLQIPLNSTGCQCGRYSREDRIQRTGICGGERESCSHGRFDLPWIVSHNEIVSSTTPGIRQKEGRML